MFNNFTAFVKIPIQRINFYMISFKELPFNSVIYTLNPISQVRKNLAAMNLCVFQVLSATPNVVNPILYGCLRPDLRKLASDLINGYISTRTSTATANTVSFRYAEPAVQKLISNRRASQIKHI